MQMDSGLLLRMQTYTTVKSENNKKKPLPGIAVGYIMVLLGWKTELVASGAISRRLLVPPAGGARPKA